MDINQVNSAVYSIGFAESFATNYLTEQEEQYALENPNVSARSVEEAKELVAAIARIEAALMTLAKENQSLINTLSLIDIARKS